MYREVKKRDKMISTLSLYLIAVTRELDRASKRAEKLSKIAIEKRTMKGKVEAFLELFT